MRLPNDIPATPPAELDDEIAAAWDRAAGFAAEGLDLHVAVGRVSGRVRGTLRLEDEVLLRLSPTQILALACGDPVPMRRPG